jgi:hypothetical protein
LRRRSFARGCASSRNPTISRKTFEGKTGCLKGLRCLKHKHMHLHVNCSARDCLVNPVDRRGGHNGRRPRAYRMNCYAAIFIIEMSASFDTFEKPGALS